MNGNVGRDNICVQHFGVSLSECTSEPLFQGFTYMVDFLPEVYFSSDYLNHMDDDKLVCRYN